jgi:uncharacterized membrane protein YoaK (UPF0700 family)
MADERSQIGLLVRALLLLTAVTGVVDSVTFLALGRVFVANMTGNVIFLGFAVAGVRGLSLLASTVALAAFLGGAIAGGRLAGRFGTHRGWLFVAGCVATTFLVAVALLVSLTTGRPPTGAPRYALIVILAVAMGIQNAMARSLAVTGVSTNVLTSTLTAMAAESPLGGGTNSRPWRPAGSVAAMFAGALIGALTVRLLDARAALAVALFLLVCVVVVTADRARRTPAPAWAKPSA